MILSPAELKKIRNGVRHIIVIPFDMDKMNADLNKAVKEHHTTKDTETFATVGRYAFIKGTQIVVEADCVGEVLTDRKVTVDVFGRDKGDGDKIPATMDMFPRYRYHVLVDELIEQYGQPEITLEAFRVIGLRITAGYYPIWKL